MRSDDTVGSVSIWTGRQVSRRRLLKLAGAGGAVLALATACAAPPAAQPTTAPAAQPTVAPAAQPTAAKPAAKAEGAPKRGGVLVIGQDTEPVGLDPHTAPAWSSQNIYEHIFEPLLRLDADGKLQPNLALKWEQPDERTYVFELRQGVKFHNGRELTAEDVKFNFERQADPKVGGVNRAIYQDIQATEVLDKYKVKATLKAVSAPFLSMVASPLEGMIIPKDAGDVKTQPVGTGPFKFVEYVSASHIKLVRNPDYWDKEKPYLDGILFKVVKDEQARVAAIRTGEVDMTWLRDPSVALPLQKEAVATIIGGNYNKPVQLFINNTRKPLSDKRVRQAISLAINRQEMIQTVVQGLGQIATVVPPIDKFWLVPEPEKLPYHQPDVQRAKQLLAEAGQASGVKITIAVPAPFPLHISDGELIQGYLKAVGITAELIRKEWGQHLEDQSKLNYDLSVSGARPYADPDKYFYPDFHSESPNTQTGYKNPEMDKLLDRGRRTVDLKERQKIYWDAQRLIAEDTAMIWPYSEPVRFEVVKQYVKGYRGIDKFLSRYPQLNEVWLDK